jgi:hypothetical protein
MDAWSDGERGGWGAKPGGRRHQRYPASGIEDPISVLRERVETVTARERELVEMRSQVARRLASLDKRGSRRAETRLSERETQVAVGEEKLAQLELELQAKIAVAEEREREAAFELSLANAEREKLDERQRAAEEVERELAELRRRLDDERAALPPVPGRDAGFSGSAVG